MTEYGQENATGSFNIQSLLQIIRAAGAILGLIAITIGLVYATRVFAMVYGVIHEPETLQDLQSRMIKALGGEQMDVSVAGATYHSANVVAISALGGGAAILAWISMGLMLTGAKIMSWILSDREAIKKIMAYAFRPAGNPGSTPSNAGK